MTPITNSKFAPRPRAPDGTAVPGQDDPETSH